MYISRLPQKRTISWTNWKIQIFVSNLFIVVFNKCVRLRFKIFTIEQDKGSLSLKIKQIERTCFLSFCPFFNSFKPWNTPKIGTRFISKAILKYTNPKFEPLTLPNPHWQISDFTCRILRHDTNWHELRRSKIHVFQKLDEFSRNRSTLRGRSTLSISLAQNSTLQL